MKTTQLTFRILETYHHQFRLLRDPGLKISFAAWERLSEGIANEPDLLNCSAQTLNDRLKQNMAACAVYKGEIVSYISRIPFLSEMEFEGFGHLFSFSQDALPSPEILQSITGWTRPDWRKIGVFSFLTKQLCHYQYLKSLCIEAVSKEQISRQLRVR